MTRRILIRDLTLRDGQQSQFATRMTQAQVDRLLVHYPKANFYAMEVWGGAVPDSVMRFLGENPWHRLEGIKEAVGGISKLTALSRGRNLFGYNPYPDSVIEGFCRNAVHSGIDIMRIFDALNDTANMESSIRFVKAAGGLADCAVCYTVDPHFTFGERVKGFLKGKPLPGKTFTVDYFVEKAARLEQLGADMISIKDMAGLITPQQTARLVRALKARVKVPIDLHTHCTPGFGLASVLVAMVEGADVGRIVFSGRGAGGAPTATAVVGDILAVARDLVAGVRGRSPIGSTTPARVRPIEDVVVPHYLSLQVTDRLKDVIKTGGEWVSSLELESIISEFAAVNEVAVVGIKDDKWGERPLPLIVLKEGQSATLEEIKQHVQKYADAGNISR